MPRTSARAWPWPPERSPRGRHATSWSACDGALPRWRASRRPHEHHRSGGLAPADALRPGRHRRPSRRGHRDGARRPRPAHDPSRDARGPSASRRGRPIRPTRPAPHRRDQAPIAVGGRARRGSTRYRGPGARLPVGRGLDRSPCSSNPTGSAARSTTCGPSAPRRPCRCWPRSSSSMPASCRCCAPRARMPCCCWPRSTRPGSWRDWPRWRWSSAWSPSSRRTMGARCSPPSPRRRASSASTTATCAPSASSPSWRWSCGRWSRTTGSWWPSRACAIRRRCGDGAPPASMVRSWARTSCGWAATPRPWRLAWPPTWPPAACQLPAWIRRPTAARRSSRSAASPRRAGWRRR